MNDAIGAVLATLGAYLIGSIPFGFLIARSVRGIDIREHGSGNIGATNVSRVVGGKWGLAVLVLDALKGGLPVWLLPMLLLSGPCTHTSVLCGLATIVGHMYPCWLKLRGGKGVATALGVIVVLAPSAIGIAVLVFALTMLLFRRVALSSMSAALAFAVWQTATTWPESFSSTQWSLGVFSIAVPLLIVFRHRSNLARLLRGEEPRFHFARSEAALDSEEENSSDEG